MEAKLIGYDEKPIDITEASIIRSIMNKEDQNQTPESCLTGDNKAVDIRSPCSKPISQQLRSISVIGKLGETSENRDCDNDSQRAGIGITTVALRCQILKVGIMLLMYCFRFNQSDIKITIV